MKMQYINSNFNYNKKLKIKKVRRYLMIAALTFTMSLSSASAEENSKEINFDSSSFNNVIEFKRQMLDLNEKEELPINIEDEIEVPKEENLVTSEIEETEVIEEDNRIPVALTFDDGPGKYTDRLLDILKDNDVKATFFVLGTGVENYGDVVKKAYDNGNEIAIHGYSHTSFKKMTIEEIQTEIDTVVNLLNDLEITPSNLVRPPYGSINSNIKENLNYSFILWSVDTLDWKTKDKDAIIKEINNSIENGSIILMHDIHETTVDAVEEMLPELTDEYRFVTVNELFSLNEQELEEHESYHKVKVLEKVEE